MKCVSRPYRSLGFLALFGAWAAIALPGASGQAHSLFQQLKDHTPLLHSSSSGYLGVDLGDVDLQRSHALKLREARGAIITLIDHDAPAGKIGLKVNDVILKLNGQKVEGAEQLRLLLRAIPAGHTVSIEISRDGNLQTLSAQLADRRAIEREVWSKIGTSEDLSEEAPQMGILANDSTTSQSSGFHLPSFSASSSVGALVEPLSSQMAQYLGVTNGLIVKEVARKSEAAVAGLRPFDVILKVGPQNITTMSDWEQALHSHRGQQVQVTVLRNKKQQTITLQVDSKHCGKLDLDQEFPSGVAELLLDIVRSL